MLSPGQLQNGLRHFTGSEQFYRSYPGVLLTEVVKWLCDEAGGYWLVDTIWSYQLDPKIKHEPFQVYTLTVDQEQHSAFLSCTDGNDNALQTQDIVFTDFPLPTINLWFVEGTVMLPSEY